MTNSDRQTVKVAHVIGRLEQGGIQAMALQIIAQLTAPAFSHVVISEASERGPWYDNFANLVPIRQCPYHKGRHFGFVRRLAAMLREEKPDVVLAYLFGNHPLVAIAARLAGVPRTYVRAANRPVTFARSRWKPLFEAQLARPFCDGEIAVSRSVAEEIEKQLLLPRRRIHIFENGCNIDAISHRASQSRAARTPDGTARLLMAAFLSRGGKDHPTALRAIRLLRDRGRRLTLLLAGRIRPDNRAQAIAPTLGVSDMVQFLGPRKDVPELMGNCDVLVHATREEGMPNVLLEAMAAGIPIVATDIPPCRDVLDDGRCGLLTPPHDHAAMADAIETLLTDPVRRESVVKAGAERVRARYDIRQAVERYRNLFLDKA